MRGLGHTAYHHVGEDDEQAVAAPAAIQPQTPAYPPAPVAPAGEGLFSRPTLTLLAQGLAAWHGYKRNNGSIVWGVVWAGAASWMPAITTGIAVAQGLGRAGGKP